MDQKPLVSKNELCLSWYVFVLSWRYQHCVKWNRVKVPPSWIVLTWTHQSVVAVVLKRRKHFLHLQLRGMFRLCNKELCVNYIINLHVRFYLSTRMLTLVIRPGQIVLFLNTWPILIFTCINNLIMLIVVLLLR